MTSANGGTYGGQYPCDDWVDNLETTLSITITCFLIQGHNLSKTASYLRMGQKVSYFVLKIELIIYLFSSVFSGFKECFALGCV